MLKKQHVIPTDNFKKMFSWHIIYVFSQVLKLSIYCWLLQWYVFVGDTVNDSHWSMCRYKYVQHKHTMGNYHSLNRALIHAVYSARIFLRVSPIIPSHVNSNPRHFYFPSLYFLESMDQMGQSYQIDVPCLSPDGTFPVLHKKWIDAILFRRYKTLASYFGYADGSFWSVY